MSDLRESGSIEQDADIVALLYRDDYYKTAKELGEAPDPSLSELIIGKHRNGPTGRVEMYFHPERLRFMTLDKYAE